MGGVLNPDIQFLIKRKLGLLKSMPDREYLIRLYHIYLGKELNLEEPKTFNEKLQWLKLYNRNPEYTKLVDKYEVKHIVSEKIGNEYVIPTLGIWNSFDDINFNDLPDSFVLKCTHDSGGVYIVNDKSTMNRKEMKRFINRSLHHDYYSANREWPYKNVVPRIIAEEYLEDSVTHELRDYKFFTFNGVVKAMFIASNRQNQQEETRFDFFDENFHPLNIVNGHPTSKIYPEKPKNFDLMKKLASTLGEGIPQVRVDFYECNGRVYFGEMTFFHWSGFIPFEPESWDETFGSWIVLPKERIE